jgi:hypothetical protein
MSWSVYGTYQKNLFEYKSVSNVADVEEHQEQYQVVSEMVRDIVSSGAVGDPDGKYYVTMNGHGNPDHKPKEGWSNDFVSINIQQVADE